jgi:broad specificity phosphatase PhoE/HSP20 family molecular chaperone IbpA
VIERSQLSEMNPGVVDGMSVDEVKARFPDEWDKKLNEPYSHRFPRAESYHDLSVRLEIIIFELERTSDDVLIIGQSSVLRCLIAYLQGRKPNEIPMIHVHEGELIEISPQAYGVNTKAIKFWDPITKRKERDEAYFRGRELANAGAAIGDENLPDLSKLPLHVLEQQYQSSDDTTMVTSRAGPRASSPASSSSSTTEAGERSLTSPSAAAAATASGSGKSEAFHELNIEDYDKLSKLEKESYDKKKMDREIEEQSKLPYKWDQTLEAVTLTVALPPGTRGKDITVKIRKTSLSVVLKKGSEVILEDSLFNGIKEEDSTWSLSEGNLDVHLEKLQKDQWWPHVLSSDPKIDTTKIVPENSKLSDLDGETRAMVEKMMFDNRQKQMGKPTSDQAKQSAAMEKFKEQHPEMDFSNVKMG